MIKLSANLSKKVPIPGLEYSSQSFGASMEIEVSDADKPDAIQARIGELYSLLSNSIDGQIAGASQYPENAPTPPVARLPVQTRQPVQQQSQTVPAPQRVGYTNGRNRVAAATNGSGANGNGRRINATEAQVKCIFAICKSQGIDMAAVLADFNVADAHDLQVRDASRLIDQLKNRNGTAA